jgi:hypothetical protein
LRVKSGKNLSFYAETIKRLGLPLNARILVVCGGALDRETLLNCGYSIVTISNLNERLLGDGFAPFEWSSQDAEQLSFPDDSFDYCGGPGSSDSFR